MPVRVINLFGPKTAETLPTGQVTVDVSTVLTKFTATNQDATDYVKFSVYLVPPSGTADGTNRIVNERLIAPGETYSFPELIGHNVPANWTITTIATPVAPLTGGFDGLTILATGTKIT